VKIFNSDVRPLPAPGACKPADGSGKAEHREQTDPVIFGERDILKTSIAAGHQVRRRRE